MTHFLKCNQDYEIAINYDISHSETVNKYLFNDFYRRTNKNIYKLQIL